MSDYILRYRLIDEETDKPLAKRRYIRMWEYSNGRMSIQSCDLPYAKIYHSAQDVIDALNEIHTYTPYTMIVEEV